MPNAAAHRIGAAVVVGTVAVIHEKQNGVITHKSVAATGLAALCTRLPDILEPATSPQHRQFFHSVTFLVALSYGMARLYEWKPETPEGKFIRWALLIVGGAYAVHLLMDAFSGKSSIPLIGKL